MSKLSKACEFSLEVRRRIKERDEGRCIFCRIFGNTGYRATDYMHYIPRSRCGLGIEQNGALGCREHHRQLDQSEHRQPMLDIFRGYLMGLYDDWNEKELIYSKWRDFE